MRSEIIRLYKVVHTWTGIVAGMALFIAFFAGGLTIYQDELALWATPLRPTAGESLPLDAVPTLIARTLETHPEAAAEFTIRLGDEAGPWRMTWMEAFEHDHDELRPRHYESTLNPDGSARVETSLRSKLGEVIDALHRVVGLPFDTDAARLLMGVIALLYALALVSGVVIVLPTLVQDFFALRLGKNLKRLWMDAHNVVGIASLPFHLLMALTAVGFALHDGIYAVQNHVVHEGKLRGAFGPPPSADATPRDPAALLPPSVLIEKAQELSPTFEAHQLQYMKVDGPRAMVRVWGRDATAFSPRALGGFVAIDPYSGEVKNADYLPGRQGPALSVVGSLFALHFGAYGGAPVRWMYFLLGLAGAWLFYGGNLLWIETRRRKRTRDGHIPEQRRDVRWMASATVGVCLGCIIGVLLTISAGRWLNGRIDDVRVGHHAVYYAAFFSSIAWSFRRGGAVASVELLRVAALAAFAIPLTSLLSWATPLLGDWSHVYPAVLGVDLTALVGGFGLWWMARATARRVYEGAPDSPWSARRPEAPPPAVSGEAPAA